VLDEHCDYSEFDFSWEPAPWEKDFRHAFASQWQKDSGTYLIPKTGFTETKYHNNVCVKRLIDMDCWDSTDVNFDYTWHPDPAEPAYIYQFGTQWQKTGGPRYEMPGATDIKYVNTPRVTKTTVDDNWIIPTGEITGFDYTWHPDVSEQPYIYQFGTQHQKTGGPQYVVRGATDTKFIGEITTRIKAVASGTVLIKHLPGEYVHNGDISIVSSTRFISNYLDTLVRVLKKLTAHEYVWIISDLCDYTDFDFSWHPELWQHSMLHVFPSNEQEFGDTFFIHVESFLENAKNIKLLEWYSPLNFVPVSVQRSDPPQIQYHSDTVVDAVWSHNFQEPVVQFYRYQPEKPVTISLWQERLRTVVPLKKGGESVLVPRDAKNYIKTQIYDYPYIDKSYKKIASAPQDIVYISYDEVDSEKNYKTLLNLTKDLPNTVHRVHGVTGMQQALKEASSKSKTPWSYHVFAKTELNPDFKFDYSPDYMQIPKHYIFYAQNMSNDLVYGEMGVVLYNNKMVIESPDYSELGLDFTMSFPTEVVPELSCFGRFATSPYQAWRTAFRETSKLAYFQSESPSMDTKHRLHIWTTKAHGPHNDWVLNGARDGMEFFNKTGPDLVKLKAAFDWNWLRNYFESKYSVKQSTT